MQLFIFRRIYNPAAKWREQPEDKAKWPLIFAIHPTRESITEEEWKAMVERVGEKDNAYFAQFVEISNQVDEVLKTEEIKVPDSRYFHRQAELYRKFGAVPNATYRALEEVLLEEGFEVLKPKELTYQLPLRDYDKGVNARMVAFNERLHAQ